ncbi:MAG: hypothetical protein JNL70_12320 [Saprospiraceae bacterium]|nr:hypothetical protein [Saprospiraceae bacterium]
MEYIVSHKDLSCSLKKGYQSLQNKGLSIHTMRKRLGSTLVLSIMTLGLMAQSITGTVFNDIDANGVKATTELGIANVTVTAYAPNGTALPSVTTNASGVYTVSGLTAATTYRLEFSNFPTAYHSGPNGTQSGTSVQFATAGATNVNLGLSYPRDFCDSNPDLVVPCYVSGDNLAGGVSSADVLVKIPYSASNTSPSPTHIASAGEIGPVFGTAIQRGTKKVFTSTFLKRHVGLGPGGLGAIYVTDLNTNVSSTYVKLTDFGIDVGVSALGSRGLPASKVTSSVDATAFDLVGKAGLGSLTLTDDEKTLYTTNLYTRKLIAVQIGYPAKATIVAGDITEYTLPSVTATGGVARPFAVKYHKGKVYLGVVATAETSGSANDLVAYVLEFDHASRTFNPTPVLTVPLNYTKGKVHSSYGAVANWMSWTNNWAGMQQMGSSAIGVRVARPQPMLSDIAFTDDGDMILGFADRGGHQTGFKQKSTTSGDTQLYNGYIGGDILRTKKVGNTWVMESNGTLSGGQIGCGKGNGEGIGGGEFYCAENYSGILVTGQPAVEIHQETFMGGMVVVPSTNQVVITAMDPIAVWSGGFTWMSNTDGNSNRRYQIYETANSNNGTQGKAAGLGVTDAVCAVAPIEIGNRVWKDTDADGIQDAGEPAMQGVTVKLYAANGTTVLATATTDANGAYYFSSKTGTSTANTIYGVNLQPETDYYIKVTALGSHSSVSGISLSNVSTGGTAGVNSGTSLANNDATLVSGVPTIQLKTGTIGANNHTYDFGFTTCNLNVTAANTGPFCAGSTISLTSTGASGSATYAWTGPNSFTSTAQNPTVNSASSLKSGVYTVIVTDGGCKDTATTTVVVNTVTATAGGAGVCAGETINLTASGGTSYAWSGPNGFTSTAQNPSVSPAVAASAGTYTVTVTGSGGCTSTASVTVAVNSASATATGGGTVCTGSTISLSATGGGTYAWSGPNNFASSLANPTVTNATSLNEGTYTVTVTAANGCKATASTSATISIPTATATSNAPVCAGGTINLTATGGGTYSWSGPNSFTSNSATPSVLSATTAKAGTYTVTVTNANGCSTTASTNVSVTTVSATASATNTCVGGSISLSATGGTSYAWSGPNSFTNTTQNPTIAPATAANAGTYTVTVTNAGCSATATATVSVANAPTASVAVSPICAGGSIQLAASSGGVSYAWSGPNGYTSTQQNPVISPATTAYNGTYTVTMTGSSGCSGTANVSVTVNALPTATAGAVSNAVCVGNTINLNSSGGGTYAWSGPNGFTSSVQSPTIANATSVNAGTYTVTVTSAAGCTSTASTTITINTASATASTSTPIICEGSNISLSATGGGTYSWSGPNAFTSSSATPSLTAATAAASGVYTVTVTSNGCTATATTAVTVNKASVTAFSNSPVCVGQTLSLSATAGASSYSWTGPNGFTSTSATPSVSSISSANAGTYNVTITDANGCTASTSTTVTTNALPNPTATKAVVCKGETINLNSNGLSPLQWTYPDATTSTTANPSIANATAANSGTYTLKNTSTGCTATYDVLVMDGQACLKNYAEVISSGLVDPNNTFADNSTNQDDDATAQICYTDCVQPDFTLTQVQATCNGGAPNNTSIAVSGISNGTKIGYSEGTTYTGADFATATTFTGATYAITGIANPVVATTYTIRIYNGGSCCYTDKQVVINPSPCATASNSGPVCQSFDINLSATGGGTYAWSGPDGFSSTSQNPTITGMTSAKAGVYTVTVTLGSYTSTATTTVEMFTPPTITASSNTPVPTSQLIQFQSTSVPTYGSYTWSGPNGFSSAAQNPTVTSSAAAAGTYTVTVTDEHGCVGTATTNVSAPPPTTCTVTASASANATYCEGDTIYLTASGGAFYNWSGPNSWSSTAQNPVITDVSPIHSGTYTVTVTGANGGCTDVASVTLTVFSKPYLGADQTVCESDTLTLVAYASEFVLTDSVRGNWTSSLPSGVTVTTIPANPTSDSLVKFIFTNTQTTDQVATIYFGASGGCTDTVLITVKPTPALSGRDTSVCNGSSVDLTSLINNYATYLNPIWKEGSTTGTTVATPTAVTPSVTTTYYVTADSSNGCKATIPIVVTVNTVPTTPSVTSPILNVCPASTINLTTVSSALTPSVSGGVFEWHVSNSSSSALVTNPSAAAAGDYYLFEKSPLGCYSVGLKVTAALQVCCPTPNCIPVIVTRQN